MVDTSWKPKAPVNKKLKEILEDLGARVSVTLERTLGDVGLVVIQVRARINSTLFPAPYDGLSSDQVTEETPVGTLLQSIRYKLSAQGRQWP